MQLYTIFPQKNINVDFSFNLKGNNKDSISDYFKFNIDFLDNKSLDCYKDISYKYIFRDKLRPYIYVITDEFKKMVVENNLKMQFLELYDIDNTGSFCFTLE